MAGSPITIRLRGTLVEVEDRNSGDVLAYCQIGDDENLERIADILSAKRLPSEAMFLRQMAQDVRRPLGRKGEAGKGQVGYLKR